MFIVSSKFTTLSFYYEHPKSRNITLFPFIEYVYYANDLLVLRGSTIYNHSTINAHCQDLPR